MRERKEKNTNLESLESKIFGITIAHLSNSNKELNDNDFIELNDVKISMDLFKNCFFNNNSRFFELNHQFRDSEAFKLNIKTIKYTNFKHDKNNTKLDLYDIMTYKYIKNKKTKLNDGSRLFLMRELSDHTSLTDFTIYHSNLSYENILNVFNNYRHRKNKKYFRFKIKVNYYSVNLDENLVVYFNYLVKIPKKGEESNDDQSNVSIISDEETINDEDETTVNDDHEDEDTVNDVHEETVNKHHYETVNKHHYDTVNKHHAETVNKHHYDEDEHADEDKNVDIFRENIVYSNYVKKIHNKIIEEPILITNELYNSSDDEDVVSVEDDVSESNLTESSLEETETNDSFF
jgi:hypothetical protein